MVMDSRIYSAKEYIKAATHSKPRRRLINRFYDDIEVIHKTLRALNIETEETPVWDFPVDEIEHITENNLDVVLVNCRYYNGLKWQEELRWFECPNGFHFN